MAASASTETPTTNLSGPIDSTLRSQPDIPDITDDACDDYPGMITQKYNKNPASRGSPKNDPQKEQRQNRPISRSTMTAATGPTITKDSPHRVRKDFSLGRSSSAPAATMRAPVVEKGQASTIAAQTPIRLINAHPLTPPEMASGTDMGTSAARIPVV